MDLSVIFLLIVWHRKNILNAWPDFGNFFKLGIHFISPSMFPDHILYE